METANQNEKKNAKAKPTKQITLPSGVTAEMFPFKGKDVKSASRLANGDEYSAKIALIAISTEVGGKKLQIEDYDEMDGRDVMMLMAEFAGLF